MPSYDEAEWSDSDDESISDIETSVLLGVPDGVVEEDSDLKDAAVSRIGGLPAFLLSTEPPFSSSQCKNCSFPMELLTQLFCPFEDSPMDRVLYIWGCARSECQHKDGTIRAWRALKLNEKYAAKLDKIMKKKEKLVLVKREEERAAKKVPKTNPFSMNSQSETNTFGSNLGSQIFGKIASAVPEQAQEEAEYKVEDNCDVMEDDNDDDDDGKNLSASELVTALAATSLKDSPWNESPVYLPSHYLSTISEYLTPTPKNALLNGVEVQNSFEDEDVKKKDAAWAFEGYENSLETDQVFDRFLKRVQCEGDQCIRYDLSGTPLPYCRDNIFSSLFPAPQQLSTTITKADFKVTPPAPKRTYDPQVLPPCPQCGAKRVFECQLMPNLLNILKPSASSAAESLKKQTDAERRKEVENILKGNRMKEARGMEWGTCMIFSCEKDCCSDEQGEKKNESWKEEYVLVQWDN